MLEQNCGCSVDHQEEIIGICLSDKCVNNAQFCYNCLRQFHYEHQKQCQTFKNLFNQLVEDKKQLQIYVNYVQIPQIKCHFLMHFFQKILIQISIKFLSFVKQFKVIFDEIYRKQLEKSQENIEKLNSINLRIKEKSFYPTDSDIHFLRNYKSSQQYFQQWIAKLEWIEKQVYNQKDYQDQDQNKTDQQTIDKTQNQKRATEPDLTDGQTIDQNQNQKNTDVVVQQGIDLILPLEKLNTIQQQVISKSISNF